MYFKIRANIAITDFYQSSCARFDALGVDVEIEWTQSNIHLTSSVDLTRCVVYTAAMAVSPLAAVAMRGSLNIPMTDFSTAQHVDRLPTTFFGGDRR